MKQFILNSNVFPPELPLPPLRDGRQVGRLQGNVLARHEGKQGASAEKKNRFLNYFQALYSSIIAFDIFFLQVGQVEVTDTSPEVVKQVSVFF